MSIRLMISCDDCGLSQGIDQAVIQLHQKGMATAATLMTNFPNLAASIEAYHRVPSLELGIHLNLSDGKPLTASAAKSELVRSSGKFHDRYLLFALSVFPSEKLLAIMREELKAQIEAFLEVGVQPAHLTTHCHFHVFPAVRNLVYELAAEYKVQWVRNSDFRLSLIPFNPIFSNKNGSTKNPLPFAVPDYIISLQHWLDHPPATMLNDLLNLEGWVELVVHPSLPDDASYPSDVLYSPQERYKEMQYLETFFDLLQPYLGGAVELVQGNPQMKVASNV